jgi:hypothetical protein
MSRRANRVGDRIGDAASVLLIGPLLEEHSEAACIELLTPEDPSGTNVLSVTLSQTPSERLAIWGREVGERLPKRASIVDATGRGATGDDRHDSDLPPSVSLDILPGSAGPVDVGVAVAHHLGRWAGTDERTVLCLHSLTALLDAFEADQVVDLVNSLNDLCASEGVRAHHHLDPSAHDEKLVARFRPLYDAVVEQVPDEGWRVSVPDPEAPSPSFRRDPTWRGESDGEGTDPAPLPTTFDRTLTLLSSPRRRAVLDHLQREGREPVRIDDLVESILAHEGAADARREVRTSLSHADLPRLADLGVVSVEGDTVRYHPNPALESVVRRIVDLDPN